MPPSVKSPILPKILIAPDVKLFRLEASYIGQEQHPGKFVILRVHEHGERNPMTISNGNPYELAISINVQEIGRTAKKHKQHGK